MPEGGASWGVGRTETCCIQDSPRTVRETAAARLVNGHRTRAWSVSRAGMRGGVFLFFSNRLGCLGSLIVSAILTLIVLALLGVL